MLGENLVRFKDQKYLIWDLEAEGLNLFYTRPWQIAYAIATLKGVEKIVTEYIYWEDLNVSKDAARITNFDIRKYKKEAKPAEEVLSKFDELLYSEQYHSLFHNGLNYDVYVHKTWRRLMGRKTDFSYLKRAYDTSAILKGYKKQWTPDFANFIKWQYQMNNFIEKGLKTNLTQMGKEFGIKHNYDSLHSADSDIDLTQKVFKETAYKYEF